MCNEQNLEMLHFLLSTKAEWLNVLAQRSFYLGTYLDLYPLQSVVKLQPYFEYVDVSQWLQQMHTSRVLNVLDLGCGVGWEAFALAFLLYPAKVVGISNDPRDTQKWAEGSEIITAGAIQETLPRLLREIQNALLRGWISDTSIRNKLDKLRAIMETIYNQHLDFMQHDIQKATWPSKVPLFDLVFSRCSFSHAEDRKQALQVIIASMADTGIFLLHEPTIAADGRPGLTPEWFDQVAVQQVGFADCQTLEVDDKEVVILLRR